MDNVKHPSHYRINDTTEVIDVREWWLCGTELDDQTKPLVAHTERALEYLLRSTRKGGLEDVQKAYQYLHRALHGSWPE